ncbi:universal stress protein [Embleya hyalina]|uniref:Universal stress protein n=1 Tax=Embleya hyalina TaxID=516124 RepID=A0A401YMR6_9ACTN|nr:universal stress protein [Embleya hyalina]GCD95877.1 universal stress protein [Embleya hyalina]
MTAHVGATPIVVGVEHTDAGRLAVVWAADEAARRGLPLRLVHALDWPIGADRHPESNPHRLTWGERFRATGVRALDEARESVATRHPRLSTESVLADGPPVAALREHSRDAAMIVLGSRRLSTAAEMLTTGGIAVPIAAHATCPVVVVREPEHTSGEPPTIVVAVDGARHSEPAVAYAFDEAARRGATIVAVNVRQMSGGLLAGLRMREEMQEGRLRLAETLAGWTEKYPSVPVHREVAVGHPVAVLREAAEHALCLVVGSRGRGGFAGLLLGSVGQGLIHHARCPLVIVPTSADETSADHD